MIPPFRLAVGDIGPVQQSPVTCGSACLTVARMLVDPMFASWIRTGSPALPGSPPGATQAERFAAYERIVHQRTNGLRAGGGRLNLPWPKALGTPPWGAKAELEFGASVAGTRYEIDVVRRLAPAARGRHFELLLQVVAEGAPALLYVGDATLPRHVVLILPGDGDCLLDVYEPTFGHVGRYSEARYANARLELASWDVPWFVVRPSTAKPARAFFRLPQVGDDRLVEPSF